MNQSEEICQSTSNIKRRQRNIIRQNISNNYPIQCCICSVRVQKDCLRKHIRKLHPEARMYDLFLEQEREDKYEDQVQQPVTTSVDIERSFIPNLDSIPWNDKEEIKQERLVDDQNLNQGQPEVLPYSIHQIAGIRIHDPIFDQAKLSGRKRDIKMLDKIEGIKFEEPAIYQDLNLQEFDVQRSNFEFAVPEVKINPDDLDYQPLASFKDSPPSLTHLTQPSLDPRRSDRLRTFPSRFKDLIFKSGRRGKKKSLNVAKGKKSQESTPIRFRSSIQKTGTSTKIKTILDRFKDTNYKNPKDLKSRIDYYKNSVYLTDFKRTVYSITLILQRLCNFNIEKYTYNVYSEEFEKEQLALTIQLPGEFIQRVSEIIGMQYYLKQLSLNVGAYIKDSHRAYIKPQTNLLNQMYKSYISKRMRTMATRSYQLLIDYYNPCAVEMCREIDFKGELIFNLGDYLYVTHPQTKQYVRRISKFIWRPGASYAQTKFFRKQRFGYEQCKLTDDVGIYRRKINEFFFQSRRLLLDFLDFTQTFGFDSIPASRTNFGPIIQTDDQLCDEYLAFLNEEAWTNNTNRIFLSIKVFSSWYTANKDSENKIGLLKSNLKLYSEQLLKIINPESRIKDGIVKDLLKECKRKDMDWVIRANFWLTQLQDPISRHILRLANFNPSIYTKELDKEAYLVTCPDGEEIWYRLNTQ